jgi:hypothetical protein
VCVRVCACFGRIQFDKIEVVNRLRKNLVYETVKNYTIHYDRTWIFEKM